MVYEKVKCPYCGSEDVVRNGKSPTGRPIEVEIHNAFVNPDEGLPVEMDEM